MTQVIESLLDIVAQYDAIVLDQWGVLHDGTKPYPDAVDTLQKLNGLGVPLAVLSNSGKRAAPNAVRIADMGFQDIDFVLTMTSGEALWQDIAANRVTERRLFAITGDAGDAAAWASGLDISLCDRAEDAEAILLMGLPDRAEVAAYHAELSAALARHQPILCTNPDRGSPRAHSRTVVSPGALAHEYADRGGTVHFYGKPHRPIFTAVEQHLTSAKLLMVGDSLEHDIAGGYEAGWDTVFITGGLHQSEFEGRDTKATVAQLARAQAAALPTYTLAYLR